MIQLIKKVIKKVLNKTGYELVNKNFKEAQNISKIDEATKKITDIIPFLVKSGTTDKQAWDFISFAGKKIMNSKAQVMQDLFVLFQLGEKKNGFFIEFGATNGIYLSNTFLLEKEYQWSGILAEPGKIWNVDLFKNRSCIIDTRCVWNKTGDNLTFNETLNPEISTINSYSSNDSLSNARKKGVTYNVETVSLNDLLEQHNAPYEIDYLSIDTEGSEYDILSSFDFNKYSIKIITVEHNFSPNRIEIYNLLYANGYKRVFETISLYDDWYVKQ